MKATAPQVSPEPQLDAADGDPVPFDYAQPADLYFPSQVGRKGGLGYRRFASAALALSFAMESLVEGRFSSATLEVDGERYDSAAIRRLYAAPDFPRT